MIEYILKSTLSLIVLFGFYWLVLRKEKLLEFNRYFLIISLCFSLLVPFVSIQIEREIQGSPEKVITTFNSYMPQINTIQDEVLPVAVKSADEGNSFSLSISQILMIIYIAGVMLFLLRFLTNISRIFFEIKRSEKLVYSGYQVVLTEKRTNPYCFFNSIFIHRNDFNDKIIDNNLLNHELGHIRQYHSADIVFFEIIRIFYWFNPVLIYYNSAIRLNHEYLADERVLRNSGDIQSYAGKLLNFASLKRGIALASGFNYSLVKKRLIMISRNRSGIINDLLRITATLIVGFILFFIMSCEQKEPREIKMQFVPQGHQQISAFIHKTDTLHDAVISVGAFLMSNEITNREYRDFVNYIKSNPGKLLRQVEYKQEIKEVSGGGTEYGPTRLIIDFIKYDSIADNLIDPVALEKINKKYRNYFTSKKYDNYPVTGVSQKQATWFCLWKSDFENEKAEKEGILKGYNYRLPLEAEWEYAAHLAAHLADTLVEKGTGEDELLEVDKGTENEYGLYHFRSNVSEWLESHDTPGIVRGGSWISKGGIEERKICDPGLQDGETGFRIVRSYSAPGPTGKNIEGDNTGKMFTGTWELNKSKSASIAASITTHKLTLSIVDKRIKIDGQVVLPDREPLNGTETYLSDGGTVMIEKDNKIHTISCSWSDDSKSIMITTRIEYAYRDTIKKFRRTQTFSLADEGKTMIVNYNDSLPEGSPTPVDERNFNLVYDKR